MSTMAELMAEERARDEWILQSALGKAIHQSFQTIIHEPLPNRMALLLLQLALDKAINPGAHEAPQGDVPPSMDEPEKEFVKANRHVAEAERIVARQRERIVRLQAENCPIEHALELLDTFIKTLAAMKHHQRLLRAEVKGKDRSASWALSRIAARHPGNILSPRAST